MSLTKQDTQTIETMLSQALERELEKALKKALEKALKPVWVEIDRNTALLEASEERAAMALTMLSTQLGSEQKC